MQTFGFRILIQTFAGHVKIVFDIHVHVVVIVLIVFVLVVVVLVVVILVGVVIAVVLVVIVFVVTIFISVVNISGTLSPSGIPALILAGPALTLATTGLIMMKTQQRSNNGDRKSPRRANTMS